MGNKLNKEQKQILEHTEKNGIYCGDSNDMTILCDMGLMGFSGRKSFVPDGYYHITREGENAIRD